MTFEERKVKALETIAKELRRLRIMKEAELNEEYSLVWDFD